MLVWSRRVVEVVVNISRSQSLVLLCLLSTFEPPTSTHAFVRGKHRRPRFVLGALSENSVHSHLLFLQHACIPIVAVNETHKRRKNHCKRRFYAETTAAQKIMYSCHEAFLSMSSKGWREVRNNTELFTSPGASSCCILPSWWLQCSRQSGTPCRPWQWRSGRGRDPKTAGKHRK